MNILSKARTVIIFTFTLVIFQAKMVSAEESVSKIAQDVTLKIISNSHDTGSGVIIKHQGNIYTVLTAEHVLRKSNNSQGIVIDDNDKLEVVTSDNEHHSFSIASIKRFPDIDLAIFQFTSDKIYRVVEIGDSTEVNRGSRCFVSGFSINPGATQASYRLSSGFISAKASQPSEDGLKNGYALGYLNETFKGMSGGPLLNQKGQLIGIHGYTLSPYRGNDNLIPGVNIKLALNLAIPINTFLALAPKVDEKLSLKQATPENKPKEIIADDYFLKGISKITSEDYTELAKDNRLEIRTNIPKDLMISVLKDLDQAIQLSPDYDVAYLVRGIINLELKNQKQAQEDLNKTIELNPNIPVTYIFQAVLNIYNKNWEAAERSYQTFIRKSTDNSLSHTIHATTLLQRGDVKGALRELDEAIKVDSMNANIYFMRSWFREALGDCKGAVEDISKAAQLDQENKHYDRNINDICKKTNRREVGSKFGHLESKAVDILSELLMKNRGDVKDIFINHLSRQGRQDIIVHLLDSHYLWDLDIFDPNNAPERSDTFKELLNLPLEKRKVIVQETEKVLSDILSGQTIFNAIVLHTPILEEDLSSPILKE